MPALPHTQSLLWRASEGVGKKICPLCVCDFHRYKGQMHDACGPCVKTGLLLEVLMLSSPSIRPETK